MKKLVLMFSLLLLGAGGAFGQGVIVPPQTAFQIVNGVTRPIPNATITVCAASSPGIPCAPALTNTIFKDAALTQPLSNPFTADNNGNYVFAVAGGTYTVTQTAFGFAGYSYQLTVGGGGGGGGTVGPGTPPTLAEFGPSTTQVQNSTVTDDLVNPVRSPDGINTASGPLADEWLVDTGGVLANHLVCRSGSSAAKVVICPAGATLTVIGVAQSTVGSGGTVVIDYGAKAQVCTTNVTTVNDWLIPSVTTPGCVDDTGSSVPPTAKVFTWPAETAVSGGSNVQITQASLDTLIAQAGGGLPSCLQYSLISETGAGTGATYGCINQPTGPSGAVFSLISTPPGTAANSTFAQNGVGVRTVSGTTDTIVCADTAPKTVRYTNSGAVTVTVPDIGSSCFSSNPVFKAVVDGSGTVTFNRTSASQFFVDNGTSSTLTNSFTASAGDFVTFQNADNTNWLATITVGPSGTPLGAPTPTWRQISGNYTVPDSDQGFRDLNGGTGSVFTLGTPNSISTNPIVATRVQVGNVSASPFQTAPFAQSASNQLFIAVVNDSGTPQVVSSISDLAGDFFVKRSETISGGATSVSFWTASSIAANGANKVTITWAGNPGRAQIYVLELTGTAFDSVATTTGSFVSTAIHFSNAVAIGVGFDGIPAGWNQNGAVNGSETDNQLQHNVASATYGIAGANPTAAIGVIVFSTTASPSFVSGWFGTLANNSLGMQAITPATGLIQGQTTLQLFPNEWCDPMSNGVGYSVKCGFLPNSQTNGVNGASITVSAADQTAGTASIGATTLIGTGPTFVSRYMMAGYADVTVVGTSCAGSTTVVLNAIFTDPNASSATTLALGTFTITTNGTVGTSNFSYPPVYFKAKVSTNIQFSTTYTAGGSCSPAPTVQVTPILQAL